MNKNVTETHFNTDLEQIQNELELLLSGIKPEDKLKEGDKITLEKNVQTLSGLDIEKGNTIKILKIKKPKDEHITTRISFEILETKEVVCMSKGIFIVNFCTDIVTEEKNLRTKIDLLKKEEKKVRKELEKSDSEEVTEEIKEKVGLLIQFTKLFKKKVKK